MTTALRGKIREERGPLNFYEFGKARDAYQARWPEELVTLFATLFLFYQPYNDRSHLAQSMKRLMPD